MAQGGRRARGEGGLLAWPGYVDALSTLLMVLIFVLLVFVLAQGFLSVALSSRDRALDRLNRQVAELAEMLALERGQAQELRSTLARATEELRVTAAARDVLAVELRDAREARERAVAERDTARGERDRLGARVADLELAARGGAERLAGLEAQLAEALRRAEATSGESVQTVRRLAETSRGLAAEQAARAEAEARAGALERRLAETQAGLGRQLAEAQAATEAQKREAAEFLRQIQVARAELGEAQRLLAAMRQEMAGLNRQASVDRATIEARVAELARLTEQTRALAALRDQLERQVREAEARAAEQAQARQAAEARAAEQAQARQTADTRAAEQAQARQAADTRAAEQLQARQAAEARAAEQLQARQAAERATAEQVEARRRAEANAQEATRLGEQARAQVALLNRQLEELRRQLTRIAGALDAAEVEGREKESQITQLGAQLNAALAAQVEELRRYRSDFFGRLRTLIGDRPGVRTVGDRFVFQSEVLFPIGSAEPSPAGQQQIREIAGALKEISAEIPKDVNWVLRVDGHADRTPLRASSRFPSNWELAAARAIAVAQILIAEGLPADRVAATSFGDNQPLDPTDTPEAYARNRRIELRLTDR